MIDATTTTQANDPNECDYYGELWAAIRNQSAVSRLLDALHEVDVSRLKPKSATAWMEILDRIQIIHADVLPAEIDANAAYRTAILEGKVKP